MANLTIKRKKAYGYALQDKIKITIDDETIIEISPKDSNTITLPDGNHKINFYYYKSINLPIIGTTELKINETHEFSIIEDTIISIAISNGSLKIKENNTKVKTESSVSNIQFGKWNIPDLYKFVGIIYLLCLPLFVGIFIWLVAWNAAAAISCIINGIFMISIPSGLHFWCKNSELIKFYDKKYIIFSSTYTVIVTVLAFFLPFRIGLTVISSIIALAILCTSIIRNTSLHYEKIILIALVVALLFSFLFSLIKTNDASCCNHPACKENGPFPCYGKNNTCPNYTNCYKDLYCDSCD